MCNETTEQQYAAHDKAVNDNSQAGRREVARALGMPFEDEESQRLRERAEAMKP